VAPPKCWRLGIWTKPAYRGSHNVSWRTRVVRSCLLLRSWPNVTSESTSRPPPAASQDDRTRDLSLRVGTESLMDVAFRNRHPFEPSTPAFQAFFQRWQTDLRRPYQFTHLKAKASSGEQTTKRYSPLSQPIPKVSQYDAILATILLRCHSSLFKDQARG